MEKAYEVKNINDSLLQERINNKTEIVILRAGLIFNNV